MRGIARPTPALLIHGGAGTAKPGELSPEAAENVRQHLLAVLEGTRSTLESGAPALDVVQRAVQSLEDDPLFNAGRGGAFTSAGTIEHDAALMRGADGAVGAVAAVRGLRNPIRAARAVMERSPHTLLAGEGAERFAADADLVFESPSYFQTERRRAVLDRIRAGAAATEEDIHGTVGAVALDADGSLAAATSTGGRTNKLPGRVGDTPIPGAGTFANDCLCAVSATGFGEHFIRAVAAHRVAMAMEFGGRTLHAAVADALAAVVASGGAGGMIALDANGETVARFTGAGMHRGLLRAGGPSAVASFRNEAFIADWNEA